MGKRHIKQQQKISDFDFRLLEVVMVKKLFGEETERRQSLIVDTQQDTIKYVEEHMDDIIANLVRMKAIEEKDRQDQNAGLEPLYALLAENNSDDTMGKMSQMFKKSLLAMAIKRFNGDRDSICAMFGISQETLDKELQSCELNLTEEDRDKR